LLDATVCYPAVTAGVGTPMLQHATGWPVVVFLHGYSFLGEDYTWLGETWASEGFVVVLSNTAQYNYLCQGQDGRALYSAVVAENVRTGSFFEGAFDVSRLALAGHSMGGGMTGAVLANNPGYRCGLALAPAFPGWSAAGGVTAPFGIVVGTGDWVTPWGWYSLPYYHAIASQDGLKFLYLLNHECDHMNIAGLSRYPTRSVFERVADVGVGFLNHFLDVGTGGLEKAVGPVAQSESRFLMLSQQIATPQIWAASPLRIGMDSRLSVAAEEGLGGIIVAASLGPACATPIGTLKLDASTTFLLATGRARAQRRIDVHVTVPNLVPLIGISMALQAYGATATQPLQLGSSMVLTVKP
jgi:pimeloyl-ACP methyl ester carboxylesterase